MPLAACSVSSVLLRARFFLDLQAFPLLGLHRFDEKCSRSEACVTSFVLDTFRLNIMGASKISSPIPHMGGKEERREREMEVHLSLYLPTHIEISYLLFPASF